MHIIILCNIVLVSRPVQETKFFFPIRINSALYQKILTYSPRNETARPRSQFLHSCIWERFIYSHDGSYLESLFSCTAWENSQLKLSSGEKGVEPVTLLLTHRVSVTTPFLLTKYGYPVQEVGNECYLVADTSRKCDHSALAHIVRISC
jgi:hypothetical protein